MNISEILANTDHTNLNPAATHEDILTLIKEASQYRTFSVCIAPYHVLFARTIINNLPADAYRPKLCTVVGFPHGNVMPQTKAFEARNAVIHGVDEVDMVINIGCVKERQRELLIKEIDLVAEACQGRVLKVIIETSMLTEEEIIFACEVVAASAADYIKTSTGYGSRGASLRDIELMKQYCTGKKIKASGGIHTLDFAKELMQAGASRIGASQLIKDYQTRTISE